MQRLQQESSPALLLEREFQSSLQAAGAHFSDRRPGSLAAVLWDSVQTLSGTCGKMRLLSAFPMKDYFHFLDLGFHNSL